MPVGSDVRAASNPRPVVKPAEAQQQVDAVDDQRRAKRVLSTLFRGWMVQIAPAITMPDHARHAADAQSGAETAQYYYRDHAGAEQR